MNTLVLQPNINLVTYFRSRILKAGEEGVANTYIICPSAVYGPSSGPCHKPSVFYKFVVASIIAAGHATIAGEGKNVVGTVRRIHFRLSRAHDHHLDPP